MKNILSQIYHKCIKEAFKSYKGDFNKRIKTKKNIVKKFGEFTHISAKFAMKLGVIFLPRFILYPILKGMSDVRFYILKKNHKTKGDVQRYNFFVDRRTDKKVISNFEFTKDKLEKTKRTIDRSLRTVVSENEQQMPVTMSEEEKGLQLLAKQQ